MDPKKYVRKLLPGVLIKRAETAYRIGRIYGLQLRYGFPARTAKVIAVTGTNGKTTTACLINEMLKSAGFATAMFTTAVVEMAGDQELNRTHRTVPHTHDVLKFFREAKRRNVDYVVIEVTSQALDQHKLRGIPIEIAVITNITQDHLDYHGSMEDYAEAKARLVSKYSSPALVILNRDDNWYEFMNKRSAGKTVTYGQDPKSDVHMKSIKVSPDKGEAQLEYDQKQIQVETALVGEFNLYNAAAAATVGLVLGLDEKKLAKGISELMAVPGRMEHIPTGRGFDVIVDYAHTPDAIENALKALQQIAKGKVAIVFGATGDRDRGKRPLMGKVVAKHADKIYLTDDETYTEDPETIRDEVLKGIVAGGGQAKTEVIEDRRKAIIAAFKAAKPGDIVLLAGLGHQDYRAMDGQKEPWDERDIARELLEE